MKFSFNLWRGVVSLLAVFSLISVPPVKGQQARPATRPPAATAAPPPTKQTPQTKPAPSAPITTSERPSSTAPTPETGDATGKNVAAETLTLDALLAADAYAVYGELRSVGQFFNSREVLDLLAPLRLPDAAAPPEMLALFDFLAARADALATARVAFGAMPVRDKLPDALVAVELSSPEQAEKLLPELRAFAAAKLQTLAQTAPPQTNASQTTKGTNPQATLRRNRRRQRAGNAQSARSDQPPTPAVLPFHLQRAGTVVAISSQPFTFKQLRKTGEQPLNEEANFAAARARFAGETLFVYFNVARMNQADERRREEMERQMAAERERVAKAEGRSSNSNVGSEGVSVRLGDVMIGDDTGKQPAPPVNDNTAVLVAEAGPDAREMSAEELAAMNAAVDPAAASPVPPAKLTPEEEAKQESLRQAEQFQSLLMMSVFGGGGPGAATGNSGWPEAIATGVALEDDALALRALFINASDEQPLRLIPFVPVFLSGPEINTGAASILPADTDVLISASLDLNRIYENLLSSLRILEGVVGPSSGKDSGVQAQLNAFEKQYNFRIKDDLLNSLGNEIAISLPANWLGGRGLVLPAAGVVIGGGGDGAASASKDRPAPPKQTAPVFVTALNDKKKLCEILPRALAAAGLAGLGEEQLFEKRGEVEIFTFSQGTVAFIDQFLVVAPDAQTMDWIIAAYNDGETLATAPAFRDAMKWQPRQMLGQVYVSNRILKTAFEDPQQVAELIDDEAIRNLLARLPAEPGAITHVAAKDDNKLLHELRLPKSLLARAAAEIVVGQKLAPLRRGEQTARWKMHSIASAQQSYKEATDRYGTLEELEASDALPEYLKNESFTVEGYEIKLAVSGEKFEATATPTVYRKTGRLSFYIDQTGVIRGGDIGGKPATAASEPVQ